MTCPNGVTNSITDPSLGAVRRLTGRGLNRFPGNRNSLALSNLEVQVSLF